MASGNAPRYVPLAAVLRETKVEPPKFSRTRIGNYIKMEQISAAGPGEVTYFGAPRLGRHQHRRRRRNDTPDEPVQSVEPHESDSEFESETESEPDDGNDPDFDPEGYTDGSETELDSPSTPPSSSPSVPPQSPSPRRQALEFMIPIASRPKKKARTALEDLFTPSASSVAVSHSSSTLPSSPVPAPPRNSQLSRHMKRKRSKDHNTPRDRVYVEIEDSEEDRPKIKREYVEIEDSEDDGPTIKTEKGSRALTRGAGTEVSVAEVVRKEAAGILQFLEEWRRTDNNANRTMISPHQGQVIDERAPAPLPPNPPALLTPTQTPPKPPNHEPIQPIGFYGSSTAVPRAIPQPPIRPRAHPGRPTQRGDLGPNRLVVDRAGQRRRALAGLPAALQPQRARIDRSNERRLPEFSGNIVDKMGDWPLGSLERFEIRCNPENDVMFLESTQVLLSQPSLRLARDFLSHLTTRRPDAIKTNQLDCWLVTPSTPPRPSMSILGHTYGNTTIAVRIWHPDVSTYKLFIGNAQVYHRCHVQSCIHPEHLIVVGPAEFASRSRCNLVRTCQCGHLPSCLF